MLTTDSPYDEQRWVEAVMAQRGPSPASDCVPFEATATPWQIVSQSLQADPTEMNGR